MTADRDTLINLIAPHLSGGPKGSVGHMAQGWFAEQIADEILAAGWRAPTGRVWVVTEDSYGLTSVVGVYRTAELAKAAVEKDRTTPVEYMGGHMGRSHRVFEVDEHDVHDDDALDC